MLDILSKLPKLTLTNSEDTAQGWWESKKGEANEPQPHMVIRTFLARVEMARRLRESGDAIPEELQDALKITLGQSDNPPWIPENSTDASLDLHVVGKAFELSLAAEKTPKLCYTMCIMDIMYDIDQGQEASAAKMTNPEEVRTFLSTFKDLTSSPNWTFVCFCSHQQLQDMYDVVASVCATTERHYWVKPNAQRNVNHVSCTNVVENFIVGFYYPEGSKRADFQSNYENDSATHNAHIIGRVMKPYYYDGQVEFCFVILLTRSQASLSFR